MASSLSKFLIPLLLLPTSFALRVLDSGLEPPADAVAAAGGFGGGARLWAELASAPADGAAAWPPELLAADLDLDLWGALGAGTDAGEDGGTGPRARVALLLASERDAGNAGAAAAAACGALRALLPRLPCAAANAARGARADPRALLRDGGLGAAAFPAWSASGGAGGDAGKDRNAPPGRGDAWSAPDAAALVLSHETLAFGGGEGLVSLLLSAGAAEGPLAGPLALALAPRADALRALARGGEGSAAGPWRPRSLGVSVAPAAGGGLRVLVVERGAAAGAEASNVGAGAARLCRRAARRGFKRALDYALNFSLAHPPAPAAVRARTAAVRARTAAVRCFVALLQPLPREAYLDLDAARRDGARVLGGLRLRCGAGGGECGDAGAANGAPGGEEGADAADASAALTLRAFAAAIDIERPAYAAATTEHAVLLAHELGVRGAARAELRAAPGAAPAAVGVAARFRQQLLMRYQAPGCRRHGGGGGRAEAGAGAPPPSWECFAPASLPAASVHAMCSEAAGADNDDGDGAAPALRALAAALGGDARLGRWTRLALAGDGGGDGGGGDDDEEGCRGALRPLALAPVPVGHADDEPLVALATAGATLAVAALVVAAAAKVPREG